MDINQNILTILQLVVTIFVAFLTSYLTSKNEKRKQSTISFKQEGVKQQKEVLDFWVSILLQNYKVAVKKYQNYNLDSLKREYGVTNNKDVTELMVISAVQKECYIYSSRKTIKYIGRYMQEIFKSSKDSDNQDNDNEKNTKKNNVIKQMFLVGKVISNMKHDFTGEKVSVMDLLKIKLNDLSFAKKIKMYLYELKYFIWRF